MPESGGDTDPMTPIKILHTADLHLDSPFQGLPAEKAAMRRGEQRAMLEALADLVQEEAVDLVLLSGDLLDGESVYYETGEQLVRCLREMAVPVLIAPGNHDYFTASCFYARMRLPRNVTVFTEKGIEYRDFSRLGVRVYGAAFTDRTCPPLLEGFTAERTEGVWNLMCLHGDVGAPASPYNPITEEQIAASGLDYLALGHVHKASGLKKAGDTWYSWPGCPEGRGFDETGDKTVSLITLDDEGCRLETRSIAARRYETLKVNIAEQEPLLAISAAVPEDAARDIYRIILTGECTEAPDLGLLRTALEDMFFELQLQDATTVYRSIWEKAEEDTLRGLFLRKLRARYDAAADAAERARIESAVRWGLAALDNREEVVSHEDP